MMTSKSEDAVTMLLHCAAADLAWASYETIAARVPQEGNIWKPQGRSAGHAWTPAALHVRTSQALEALHCRKTRYPTLAVHGDIL